jgi:hypothetical protein
MKIKEETLATSKHNYYEKDISNYFRRVFAKLGFDYNRANIIGSEVVQ